MAVGSGISFWSFGLYIRPLEDQFGWSRAEVSLGFSISLLVSGLIAPLIGKWVDTYGPRRLIVIGAVLTGATYLLLATTNSLWQWYVYLTINAVFRLMMFFIPFQTLITRWFDRRRGIAVGILATGFSLGGFAVVPLMRVVIDAIDWDGSFIFAGAITTALFVPLGWLVIRNQPADVGAAVDGARPAAAGSTPAAALTGIAAKAAIRTPLFWAIALALMTFFFGLFGWMVHSVPFYESVGISPGWAAGLVSLAAGGGIFSRLAFGFLADRIPSIGAASMVLALFLLGAMLTLRVSGGSTGGVALFVVLFIIGSGAGPMLEPLLLARAFGVAHFATILGVVAVVESVGLIASPTAAGAIFDATGSYDWALVMFATSFAAAFFLFWLAARLPAPTLPVPEPVSSVAGPCGRDSGRPAARVEGAPGAGS